MWLVGGIYGCIHQEVSVYRHWLECIGVVSECC